MGNRDPRELLNHCQNNEIEILTSKECHCLFCGSSFPAKDVHDWTDGGTAGSALCPVCGMPAIYADSAGPAPSYGETDACRNEMLKDPSEDSEFSLRTFAMNYLAGKFAKDSKDNPNLMVAGLSAMNYLLRTKDLEFLKFYTFVEFMGAEDAGTRRRCIDTLYLKDFALDPIAIRSRAYFELVALEDFEDPIDPKAIFEGFSRALALGDVASAAGLANCYLEGIGVKKDHDIAFQILCTHYADAYEDFLRNRMDGVPTLAYFASFIASCYDKGYGVAKVKDTALRFYLIARFALRHFEKCPFILPGIFDPNQLIERAIHRLSKSLKFEGKGKEVELDEYTFFDTFYDAAYFDLARLKVKVDSFDPITHTLMLRTKIIRPVIAVDINNRQADVLQGECVWTFHDVLSVSGDGGNADLIQFIGENEIAFSFAGPTNDENVLNIRFLPEEDRETSYENE